MAEYAGLPTLPLAGKNHVLLAVSGGSDSTALLHLAVRQCRELQSPPRLTAVTIDHRLRPEAALEALSVKAACAELGIDHVTLEWAGDKPVTGIQSGARHARRALLAEAAAKTRSDLVLTGHTLDDQRETVAMRMKRGAGPGLAGIAPASLAFNDSGAGEAVWFARPFLRITRAALRCFLTANGTSWIEDPSNDNDMYERVSVRKELALQPQESLIALDLRQQDAAARRCAAATAAALLLDKSAFQTAPGLIRLIPEFFNGPASNPALIALRALMAFAAGKTGLAEEDGARHVYDVSARFFAVPGGRHVSVGSGGALADIRKQGVYLMQEQRRGRLNALAFAGRYRLLSEEPGLVLPQPCRSDPTPAPASLIRKAKASEPVFDCPATGATPADQAWQTGKRLRLLLNPWPDLVPSFDLDLAQSLAALCGAPALARPAL
ncbi:MAG: tRNA lysidine(34) synthetase TilS [Rhizobiaceae bacterium]